jgi:hypothetical protein
MFWPYKRPVKGHTKRGGEEKKIERLKKIEGTEAFSQREERTKKNRE